METVNINTSQNVQISYELAGLSDRIYAYLLDAFIIGTATLLLMMILIFSGWLDSSPFSLIIATIPAFLYHLVMEISMNGQSVGKKVLKIKVVKLNGSQATLGDYLLRWIIRPIDVMIYGGVAILCITLGGKGQRLGDMAAGTTVIKLRQSDFMQKHSLTSLDEHYVPVFDNADQLEPEFIELIEKAINIKLTSLDEKPVTAMAFKTRQRLGIDTILPDLKFLHTILKDYHHLKVKEATSI
ncbi:MAG: RDD family protein [Cyclobacteriaceae bacterium]|nr:RDD family protein [Cyclobacteriaceae bacterium]